MSEITTIGLDLAKNIFQVHSSMRRAQRFYLDGCGAANSLRSLSACRRVWSAWRLARRHIIGPAN